MERTNAAIERTALSTEYGFSFAPTHTHFNRFVAQQRRQGLIFEPIEQRIRPGQSAGVGGIDEAHGATWMNGTG